MTRPATPGDLAALTDLFRRWDVAHVGAAEHDADEVRETFGDDTPSLAERSRLLFDGERLVAAAWYWSAETTVLVDPDVDPAPLYADLVPWLAARGVPVDALATDEALQGALRGAGWTHEHSSFELIREIGDWTLATPQWPDGVRITDIDGAHLAAVHRLIYVDAAWAEVPGHPDRPFDQWHSIFVTDKEDPAQQVIAWRGDRVVGASLGRIFSDGAGWVSQLAVARDERGRGLGRALLLESLHRRVAAGATLLGLSVEAPNAGALRLYLDVGLTIDREWRKYHPPATS